MGEAAPPVFHLTDRDKVILAQTDEEYHFQTWDEVKTIIGTTPQPRARSNTEMLQETRDSTS